MCQACGLVRMTSYRTGRVLSCETPDDAAEAAPRPECQEEVAAGERYASGVNELPSVALTTRFLAVCQQHGSERLAVSIVAAGRSAGVPRLPQSNDWTAWNADEMRAAVEHLQRKLGR